MKKNRKTRIFLPAIKLFLVFFTSLSHAFSPEGMVELDENDLRGVSGQGLFVADMIRGDELTGANEYSIPFNFYRVGMDGEMQMNLNMSKLQLGCGGINDHLSGHAGCDIDIDYVSMMGRNGSQAGDPGSATILDRPYMEFAIKNDDSPTLREVVGIKIGAATVDGFMATGRRYYQGETNEENLQFASTCNPSASTGSGVVGCHSGLNSVSGFLGTDLSLAMKVVAGICGGVVQNGQCRTAPFGLLPLPTIPLEAWGCTGRVSPGIPGSCGNSQSDSVFVDIAGTRMQTLGLRAAELTIDLLGILDVPVFASLITDARSVHGLAFENTGDFFLSFQREPVAYPRYSKITPTEEFQAAGQMGIALDACATTNQDTARCHSAYAVPANTGWWMNAPSAKLVDVVNDNLDLGPVTIGQATTLLGAPGLLIENPEFQLDRAQNCYGSSTFC